MRKVLTVLMAVVIVAVACVTPPAPTDTPTPPAPTDTPTPPKPTDTPTPPKPTDTPTPPKPTDTPTTPKPPPCEPSYPDVCIPVGSADYDCAGGSGNGPNYIQGPIRVRWDVPNPDPYGLDRDRDGRGCE